MYVYIQAYLVLLLHFIALCRYCIFYKLTVCGNPVWSKSVGSIFPTAFAHFASVSHFGNSRNISNFFIIIIIFLMVICEVTIAKKIDLMKAQVMVSIF